MKICDALVFSLKALEVRYVFGVSGANIEHLHDALLRLGDGKIESVLAKSESGAAFMADAHARTHNTLGVVCTTSGGGMLNALPGIAEAYAESVPLLAIIGQTPLTLEGRGGFQDSSLWSGAPNSLELFHATTKWTRKLERASDFWPMLADAIRNALGGRNGPVALFIPRDLYDQEVPEQSEAAVRKWRTDVEPSDPCASEVDRFFHAIAQAQQPILILGQGVTRSRDGAAVSMFAQSSRIPTATTMSARHAIPNDAENYLGVVGTAGHPSVHSFIMERADVIVAVGTGLSVMARGPITSVLPQKRVIAINTDESAILRVAPHAEVIRADAGRFFRACNENNFSKNIFSKTLKEYEQTVLKPQDAPYSVNPISQNATFRQSEAIAMVEQFLPENGHILFDAGNCAAAAMHWTKVPKGSTSTIALGMGTMGYAIGGAIGAQIGSKKGCRTVAIVGDGAFLMCGLEIHTAIEMQLPILFVVFNNAGHGMCVTRQHLYFEGRKTASAYHDFSAAEIAQGLAGEYPCFVSSVETISALHSALDRYMANPDQPGVLEIRNYKEEWPPFAPFFKDVGPVMKKEIK